MIDWKDIRHGFKSQVLILAGIILLSGICNEIKAQEDPPRPPSVTLITNLSFGAFYSATGGSVTIDQYGARSSVNVTLFSFGSVSAAHFNIYANAGTVINILNIPDFQLTWSGYSMTVKAGNTNPQLPFVNTNPYSVPTELTIGATLLVGTPAANPPGTYTGTFDVILVVE
ncbi:MAG: DUF4402 domain-containing protein [Bacteroidales bacterium]|nr:DUF4402 domain-containing protein [Bacteroidales bacterium]